MPLIVLAECNYCCKVYEHTGQYLQAVELVTKEAWVIECEKCGHVFLHTIQQIQNDEGGTTK